ncbi:MazG family protein [Thermaerobacter sp. PB12/4term]|uniref:nucleoside triphosphate pyrophosphohydrolase n=1 Tax=Thermaerobacter sp. PB12/4term TaxID=2293838 RepID=UPI000E32CD12|nr:MazG family protein [Thermaerobacter sp. PB12/4term]QIA26175.1 MazG family protein [Thermaerobacter sp. PB12/4term]
MTDTLVDRSGQDPYGFARLVELVRRLREPGGCPWDRAQTHRSLRRFALEEAYEVVEAIDRGDPQHLAEELGDLLLQVLLHAQIAAEAGHFDVADVCQRLADKLIRRHPHVFGQMEARSAADVQRLWAAIKAAEAGGRPGLPGAGDEPAPGDGQTPAPPPPAVTPPAAGRAGTGGAGGEHGGAGDRYGAGPGGPAGDSAAAGRAREETGDQGAPGLLPDARPHPGARAATGGEADAETWPPSALVQAYRIQERAARSGLDWPDPQGPRAKLDEELAELDEAVAHGDPQRIEEELGDVLFILVNAGRHWGVYAEAALLGAVRKFRRRVRLMEEQAAHQGRRLEDMSPEELDHLWEAAKDRERGRIQGSSAEHKSGI